MITIKTVRCSSKMDRDLIGFLKPFEKLIAPQAHYLCYIYLQCSFDRLCKIQVLCTLTSHFKCMHCFRFRFWRKATNHGYCNKMETLKEV